MNALLNTYSILSKDNHLIIIELSLKGFYPTKERLGSHLEDMNNSLWYLSLDDRQKWSVTEYKFGSRDSLIKIIKSSTIDELKRRFCLIENTF